MGMLLESGAFAEGSAMPPEFAFGTMDPKNHVALSSNINPDFRWSGLPASTQSLALLCVDPDVPSRGDDVNQEGRTVPASLPRVDFFHWALIDLPPTAAPISRGEFSRGVTPRGKSGPTVARADGSSVRHGINDYTSWFANDKDMAGNYFGYDGPCPPWNDEIPHRYVFTLYALDVPRLGTAGVFTGADVRKAMAGHILGEASVTGRYALNPAVKL